MMAAMPVSRAVRPGCIEGVAWSCVNISGEALINTQSTSLEDTAIDASVRVFAFMLPSRTPAQLRQLQFHCGKPPPAADPKMRIFMAVHNREWGLIQPLKAISMPVKNQGEGEVGPDAGGGSSMGRCESLLSMLRC